MAKQRVALMGLGIMGTGMANRLLGAQFPLAVFNRNRDRAAVLASAGAKVAQSPREAAQDADVVISMVADDGASRAMWLGADGALAGARPGTVLLECSTVTVSWALELAGAAKAKGCEFLDAPVTGSKPQAAAGELLFLVGGDAEGFAKASEVFAAMGRDAVHLGLNGSGARLKLINNFLCGVQAASLAEGVRLIQAGGLDMEKALAILTGGAPGSPLLKTIAMRATSGDGTTNFLLKLMAKDLSYAVQEAEEKDLELKTGQAALSVFQKAIEDGRGEKDLSAVVRL